MRMLTPCLFVLLFALTAGVASGQRTEKPVLHGREWVAVTGKPLAATAGAMIFAKGGNAVDAACAMLGAVCTMYDVLSWGGETQALIFDPRTGKVIGLNALGVAPTGATPEFYKSKGHEYPPEYGALSAVTPGTPGGLLTMLAEFGTMSLAEILDPAIRMAEGYPMDRETANSIEKHKDQDQVLALRARGLPDPSGRGEGGAGGGRAFPPTGPGGDPAEAGRSRAGGPGRGQEQERGHLRRLRPLL